MIFAKHLLYLIVSAAIAHGLRNSALWNNGTWNDGNSTSYYDGNSTMYYYYYGNSTYGGNSTSGGFTGFVIKEYFDNPSCQSTFNNNGSTGRVMATYGSKLDLCSPSNGGSVMYSCSDALGAVKATFTSSDCSGSHSGQRQAINQCDSASSSMVFGKSVLFSCTFEDQMQMLPIHMQSALLVSAHSESSSVASTDCGGDLEGFVAWNTEACFHFASGDDVQPQCNRGFPSMTSYHHSNKTHEFMNMCSTVNATATVDMLPLECSSNPQGHGLTQAAQLKRMLHQREAFFSDEEKETDNGRELSSNSYAYDAANPVVGFANAQFQCFENNPPMPAPMPMDGYLVKDFYNNEHCQLPNIHVPSSHNDSITYSRGYKLNHCNVVGSVSFIVKCSVSPSSVNVEYEVFEDATDCSGNSVTHLPNYAACTKSFHKQILGKSSSYRCTPMNQDPVMMNATVLIGSSLPASHNDKNCPEEGFIGFEAFSNSHCFATNNSMYTVSFGCNNDYPTMAAIKGQCYTKSGTYLPQQCQALPAKYVVNEVHDEHRAALASLDREDFALAEVNKVLESIGSQSAYYKESRATYYADNAGDHFPYSQFVCNVVPAAPAPPLPVFPPLVGKDVMVLGLIALDFPNMPWNRTMEFSRDAVDAMLFAVMALTNLPIIAFDPPQYMQFSSNNHKKTSSLEIGIRMHAPASLIAKACGVITNPFNPYASVAHKLFPANSTVPFATAFMYAALKNNVIMPESVGKFTIQVAPVVPLHGYMYTDFFDNAECSIFGVSSAPAGVATASFGFALGMCQTTHSKHGPPQSYKIGCEVIGNNLFQAIDFFPNSVDCTGASMHFDEPMNTSCMPDTLGLGFGMAMRSVCSMTPGQLPLHMQSAVINNQFGPGGFGASNCSQPPSYYTALSTDHCFSTLIPHHSNVFTCNSPDNAPAVVAFAGNQACYSRPAYKIPLSSQCNAPMPRLHAATTAGASDMIAGLASIKLPESVSKLISKAAPDATVAAAPLSGMNQGSHDFQCYHRPTAPATPAMAPTPFPTVSGDKMVSAMITVALPGIAPLIMDETIAMVLMKAVMTVTRLPGTAFGQPIPGILPAPGTGGGPPPPPSSPPQSQPTQPPAPAHNGTHNPHNGTHAPHPQPTQPPAPAHNGTHNGTHGAHVVNKVEAYKLVEPAPYNGIIMNIPVEAPASLIAKLCGPGDPIMVLNKHFSNNSLAVVFEMIAPAVGLTIPEPLMMQVFVNTVVPMTGYIFQEYYDNAECSVYGVRGGTHGTITLAHGLALNKCIVQYGHGRAYSMMTQCSSIGPAFLAEQMVFASLDCTGPGQLLEGPKTSACAPAYSVENFGVATRFSCSMDQTAPPVHMDAMVATGFTSPCTGTADGFVALAINHCFSSAKYHVSKAVQCQANKQGVFNGAYSSFMNTTTCQAPATGAAPVWTVLPSGFCLPHPAPAPTPAVATATTRARTLKSTAGAGNALASTLFKNMAFHGYHNMHKMLSELTGDEVMAEDMPVLPHELLHMLAMNSSSGSNSSYYYDSWTSNNGTGNGTYYYGGNNSTNYYYGGNSTNYYYSGNSTNNYNYGNTTYYYSGNSTDNYYYGGNSSYGNNSYSYSYYPNTYYSPPGEVTPQSYYYASSSMSSLFSYTEVNCHFMPVVPTLAPTQFPTKAGDVMEHLNIGLTLTGISAADVTPAMKTAIVNTIVSLTGLPLAAFGTPVATDVSARRLLDGGVSFIHMRGLSGSVSVVVPVTAPSSLVAATCGTGDPSAAILSKVSPTGSSSTFLTALKAAASALGVSLPANLSVAVAVAAAPTPSPSAAPTIASTKVTAAAKAKSNTVIIAAAAGGGGGVLVICILVYCFCLRGGTKVYAK